MTRSMLSATVVAILAPPSIGGTVVLSDPTLADADYETSTDGSGSSRGFSTAGSQIPIGGNPGSFRQVTNQAAGFITDTRFIRGWHFNTAQTYDPSEGAILSLDYSEDSVLVFGAAQPGWLALRQDGILYRSEESFAGNTSTTAYVNNSFSGLSASDFEAFFNGAFFPTADPDFSANGGVIEFGFVRERSATGNINDSFGVDNWIVTITNEPIPEPSGALLAIGGGLLALASRRR